MQQFKKRCRTFFDTLWPAEEKTLVFGEGRTDAPAIMLIGEAPGEQETLQGRPFVGKAGKNLDGFLNTVGVRREEMYISNVVKVRPTKEGARGGVSNRPPSQEELLLFTPYLYEEILLINPGMIVTLGNVALRALLGGKASIGEYHGQLTQARVSHGEQARVFDVFPLYHPASVIYNRSLSDIYEGDLKLLKNLLERRNSAAR